MEGDLTSRALRQLFSCFCLLERDTDAPLRRREAEGNVWEPMDAKTGRSEHTRHAIGSRISKEKLRTILSLIQMPRRTSTLHDRSRVLRSLERAEEKQRPISFIRLVGALSGMPRPRDLNASGRKNGREAATLPLHHSPCLGTAIFCRNEGTCDLII